MYHWRLLKCHPIVTICVTIMNTVIVPLQSCPKKEEHRKAGDSAIAHHYYHKEINNERENNFAQTSGLLAVPGNLSNSVMCSVTADPAR